MTPLPKTFLVVDDNADSRFLLVKTLLRKFPQSTIHECQESDQALAIAAQEKLAAIVAHRAADMDGISLIRTLREANPDVIIVMVSGLDRTHTAIRAGATCFLNYDEWLCVGSLVTDLLSRSQSVKNDVKDEASGRIPRQPDRESRPGITVTHVDPVERPNDDRT